MLHFSPKSVDEKQRVVVLDATNHNSDAQHGMRPSP